MAIRQMTIPFIRYLPDGRRILSEITRSQPIEEMAARFIAGGGRYHILIEPDRSVRVSAVMEIDGLMEDVEVRASPNDAHLLAVVDRLIKLSDLHVQGIEA